MRSQALVLLLISFFFVKFARSQSNELLVQGQTGKLYLEHTVVAKENWYSIGRLYNANPKEVAPFNHLAMTQPLNIGQTLEVPLTAANFAQNDKKLPSETLVPVFHIIQEKEWFYRISINHNKVPIPSLEKWNHINKDQAKAGMHLIVGYLKVKTALSALARSTPPATVAAAVNPPPTGTNPPTGDNSSSGGNPPTGANPPTGGAGSSTTTNPPVNPHTASNPPAGTNSPASAKPAIAKPASTKPSTTGNPPVATIQPTAPVNPGPQPATTSAPAPIHFNGGFFKAEFSETGKSASGPAGTFKSTSGWQDGKYYALMNNIPVGTIVKVSSPGTDKSVYAKILGQLPDMKESVGLTIRISNAAASELGTGEGRFNVEVKY